MALGPRFERARLWVFERDLAARMAAGRENDVYLPGFQLPDNVEVTSSLAVALEDASMVLSVMPSHLVRSLYEQMLPYLTESMAFVRSEERRVGKECRSR